MIIKYRSSIIFGEHTRQCPDQLIEDISREYLYSSIYENGFNETAYVMKEALKSFRNDIDIYTNSYGDVNCFIKFPDGSQYPFKDIVSVTHEIWRDICSIRMSGLSPYQNFGYGLEGYLIYNPISGTHSAVIIHKRQICSVISNATEEIFQREDFFGRCKMGPLVNNISPLGSPISNQNTTVAITITGYNLNFNTYVSLDNEPCLVKEHSKSRYEDTIICQFNVSSDIDNHEKEFKFTDPTLLRETLFYNNFKFVLYKPWIRELVNHKDLVPNKGLVTIISPVFQLNISSNIIVKLKGTNQKIQDIYTEINQETQQNETYITFTPNGVGKHNYLELDIDGIQSGSIMSWNVEFLDPTITDIYPNLIDTREIESVFTISGLNFNTHKLFRDKYYILIGYDPVYVEYPYTLDSPISTHVHNDTTIIVKVGDTNRSMVYDIKLFLDGIEMENRNISFRNPLSRVDLVEYNSTRAKTNESTYFYMHGHQLKSKFIHFNSSIHLQCYDIDRVDLFDTYGSQYFFNHNVIRFTDTPIPRKTPGSEYNKNEIVLCRMGIGIGSNKIHLKGYSEEIATISYSKPLVNEIMKPKEELLDTKGGFTITLNGENFVPNEFFKGNLYVGRGEYVNEPYKESIDGGREISNVFINGIEVSNIKWKSSSEIQIEVPPGIGSNLSVRVMVGLQNNSDNEVKFSYDKPILHHSSYTTSSSGYDWITISGKNFVPQELSQNETLLNSLGFENSIRIGSQNCLSIQWVSDNQALCQVPPGTGNNLSITLTVGNQSSEPNQSFSYF
ncbi:IPT/TIG domain-containing protein [Tieghemostelium lacteum]|uniref:IPT/TIG domain-containing protein n=1 Tax=Tieghemostelium lacteum TaxID=361077 RepID=A0A151Z6X0_TIELA|nr:IPT/TIG domain-containing protein [Tieghemostelium lacteum]|eukprot:KYQ89685.1 IPT/TIG domain-containing protein [Tieghemostelium lacteum]